MYVSFLLISQIRPFRLQNFGRTPKMLHSYTHAIINNNITTIIIKEQHVIYPRLQTHTTKRAINNKLLNRLTKLESGRTYLLLSNAFVLMFDDGRRTHNNILSLIDSRDRERSVSLILTRVSHRSTCFPKFLPAPASYACTRVRDAGGPAQEPADVNPSNDITCVRLLRSNGKPKAGSAGKQPTLVRNAWVVHLADSDLIKDVMYAKHKFTRLCTRDINVTGHRQESN